MAGVRLQQPEDQPEDRGFSGAAGAEEDLGVSRFQDERDLSQDLLVVECQGDAVEHDDRTAWTHRLFKERRPRHLLDRHQYINAMSSFVTRKSTAMTATDAATTALVVARPTPCVPPRVRMPTWQPMLAIVKPMKNGLIRPIHTSCM